MTRPMELRHLVREVKTSLELALTAPAPSDLIDSLAIAAGLLDAVTDMALDEAGTSPLVATTLARATRALVAWNRWRQEHPPKARA